MVRRISWSALLMGLLLALALAPAAFAQGNNAKVRVIHASPDAPAVDVYVNNNKVLTNVPFFTASDYLDLAGGSYDIKVTPTGQPDTAVIDAKGVAVEGGKAYTIAAGGKVADIKPYILSDNLAAPAAGKAHVRVVHLSPDAPAVDIKVAGGPTLISNLAFGKDSGYLPVDAGTYDLQVVPAGKTEPVVIDLKGTKLEAGKIYDVFATGELAKITPQVKVTTPVASAGGGSTTPPSSLPRTAGEDSLPVALFGLVVLLLVAGGLLLRRRA
jgi:LPXTG-motif cell wall-anchored protein